jgi:hypothetical protein
MDGKRHNKQNLPFPNRLTISIQKRVQSTSAEFLRKEVLNSRTPYYSTINMVCSIESGIKIQDELAEIGILVSHSRMGRINVEKKWKLDGFVNP